MRSINKFIPLIIILLLLSQACSTAQLMGVLQTPASIPVSPSAGLFTPQPILATSALKRTPTKTDSPTQTPELLTPTAEPGLLHLGWVWPGDNTRLTGQVMASDGTLYAMDEAGTLYALAATGEVRWKYRGKYTSASGPVLSGDGSTVYFFTDKNILFAIDKDGKEKWALDVKESIVGWPLAALDGSLYLQTRIPSNQEFTDKGYRILPDGTQQPFTWPEWGIPEDSIFDPQGNFHLWADGNWINYAPGQSEGQVCGDEKDYLSSNIVPGARDSVVYILLQGEIIARKADCSLLWQVADSLPEKGDYVLASDGEQAIYVSNPRGDLFALNADDGTVQWKTRLTDATDKIDSMIVAKNGMLYAISHRGKVVAIDRQGQQAWQQDMYQPGRPEELFATPDRGLVVAHAGQLLAYTADTALHAQAPQRVAPPGDRTQAEKEIVSYLVDFIIQQEIHGTADYIRNSGQPWVEAPPKANIIVYAPPKGTSLYDFPFLDEEKPIQVWWYADNQLTDVDDRLKAIDEYNNLYMKKPTSDIWSWGYYDFGIISVGEDFQSAEVYVGASCGPLCGHGAQYSLLRSASGGWWIFDELALWQS